MNFRELYYKGKAKARYHVYNRNFGKKWVLYLYPSYWHMILRSKASQSYENYFAARPNPGAGIGHQMANWIAGYWFAIQFGLQFAHIPFSDSRIPYTHSSWEEFLGFGQGEMTVEELIKKKGYATVRLPMFDENQETDLQRIRRIIQSYADRKIVFLAEQDQFYRDQYGVMEHIQRKFYEAPGRKDDHLVYKKGVCNIAVHIRRGDIVQKRGEENANLSMRWQDTQYFIRALENVLRYLDIQKEAHIYLFSQGEQKDYEDFHRFPHVHYCLSMSAQETFLHFCKADILITSKSSFSYKPALLNRGIKVCPQNFWHGYPHSEDWILLDDEGNFAEKEGENG